MNSGGAGGEGVDPAHVQPTVTDVGCFAVTGDGWDFLENGLPVSNVASASCVGQLVSDNPDAYAPESTPTSFTVTRDFIIDDAVIDGADSR